jgi:hypothetical protein
VYGLAAGYHDVDFAELAGWTEPQTLSVRVIADVLVYETAEYKPVPVFTIGEIPPRDAPHGSTLSFCVDANWLADPCFQIVDVDAQPVGDYSIDPYSGLFTYEPNDVNDRTPFILTFRVTSGADVNEQSVEITPIPDLPPEFTVFTEPVEGQDLPEPNSRDYIFINEIVSDACQPLNGVDRLVRSVTIAGKLIEVADVNDNLVYIYNDNNDINDVTIYAETVVISNPLNLPQTKVTIYARELIFEGAVVDINTTPMDQRIDQGAPLDGLAGGDISLYIESHDPGLSSHRRFKTTGTPGLNGGQPGYSGAVTCTLDTQQPLAWLNPYSIKMVIAHAKDAYLYGYTAESARDIAEYDDLLNTYMELPDYNSVPEQWQFQFEQMQQEAVTLLHRLENGLDYFGNPPGWTPMLSFEVWKAAYEDEIERAIRVLYLSYWLQNIADDITARADALEEGRSKLWDETVQFRTDYEAVADIIGPLKNEAAAIADRVGRADYGGCSGLLCQLKQKEAELLERADRNVEERHKVPWWKKVLKTIATVVSYTCMGARGGGKAAAAGTAGGVFVAADDLFLADDAWQSATATTDVAKQFNNIDFDDATNGCLAVFNDINDVGDIETEGGAEYYLEELRYSAKQMANGLYDVKEALTATSLDNKEVETELKKIKASDPTFRWLVDQVTELTVRKAAFNRQLAAAMQKVSTLSNGITNNILAIDAMNRQASLGNRVFDRRAVMYVKDMERRARARLLKYHYYMAKAYEYRTLQRYTWPLDIQDVFDSIADMAQGEPNHILSDTDYGIIKGVYDELFSDIRERILAQYNYGDEVTSEVLTYLSAQQLAQLNAGQTATVDPIDRIDVEEENVRVVNMSVVEASLDATPAHPNSTDCQNAYVTVRVEHSGVCNLQKDEDIYQFSYPETDISWASKCYVTGEIIDDTPSYAAESMLRALLPDLSDAQVMFYSRPAVWADISVRRNLKMNGCTDVEVTVLRLSIEYDYWLRSETPVYVTLHVGTEPAELRPYFTVDTPDESEAGRQDGIGDFYRTYIPGTSVTVTAPARYGDYAFWRWYRSDQTPLYSYEPVLEVNWMTQGGRLYTVEAEYEYDGPLLSGDINADLNVDFRDFSALAAAWLTELGDPGWDEYCDISSPADYFIDEFDLKVLCDDWLATP